MTTDSAIAKKNFEHLNNITTTLDFNSLDDGSGQEPKRVIMSDVALLKMVKHASSNSCIPVRQLLKGRKDLAGLFIGKGCGDAIVVMDACELPLDEHLDFQTNLLNYFETGGLEDVVGWYRTSALGDFPTKTDLSTQMRIQKLKDLSFGVIIDVGTTIDIVKVSLQAFRTYPEGYTHINCKRNRPEFAVQVYPHLEKRYRLFVTYFKSSLGSNDAWENFWNHLISTPKVQGKTIGLEVSADNKENLGDQFQNNKNLHHVNVKREFTNQYSSPTEAIARLFGKLAKDVGSYESGSKISSTQNRSSLYA